MHVLKASHGISHCIRTQPLILLPHIFPVVCASPKFWRQQEPQVSPQTLNPKPLNPKNLNPKV